MRCFNHPDREAVGLCKACNKGLCAACTTDLDHGLACKNKHEAAVQLLENLITRSAKVYSVTPKSRFIAPLFYGFVGLIFVFFGYAQGGILDLPFLLGVGFLVYAVIAYFFNRNAYGTGKAQPVAQVNGPASDGPAA
jgi:hypothetical protein